MNTPQHAAQSRWAPLLITIAMLAAACGGDDEPADASDATDAGETTDAGADTASDASGRDVPSEDVADTADITPDVDDSVCGDGEVTGAESCDDGNTVDDDACTNACQPFGAGLCAPCATDDDCGGSDDRCMTIADTTVCTAACDTTCQPGWTCSLLTRDNEIIGNQCVPESGDCAICDDEDEDGVCDYEDACLGFDDSEDTDEDGVPDGCDACPLDAPNDSDEDGVCDSDDICEGGTDSLDVDGDGVPNFCDFCPNSNPNDSDNDGVCTALDRCEGFDDNGPDVDQDGLPDACDDSIEICDNDIDDDGDDIVDCDDSDCALHPACAPCEVALEIPEGTVTGVTEGRDTQRSLTTACSDAGAPERAFVFTPDAAGTFCANTRGSEFNTVLYARTTCDVPATELVCNDNAFEETSEIAFEAGPEAPVYLVVDGRDHEQSGAFSLTVRGGTCEDAEIDRQCQEAPVLTDTVTSALPTTGFSTGLGEGCALADGGEAMLVYTAPTTGRVCLSTANVGRLTVAMYVRTDCADRDSEVACADTREPFVTDASLTLDTVEGTTYYVFVDEIVSRVAFGGPFTVNVRNGACR